MNWRYAPINHNAHLAMRFMIQARIDLLFTMSENTPRSIFGENATSETMYRGRRRVQQGYAAGSAGRHLVEPDGIEPTTSCLQSTRSPS